MGFKCSFGTDREEVETRLQKAGAPGYIRCQPFDATKVFSDFEVIQNHIGRDRQKEWLAEALSESCGWVAFACGMPEQVRLFSYCLMRHYAEAKGAIEWHHVTGSRWNKFLDSKDEPPIRQMLVLDSLLTHPPMHPNASRAYDPARIGKIFDIVAKYRGQTSIIVMCPDLLPEDAYRISMVQPDYMWNLKFRARDVEL